MISIPIWLFVVITLLAAVGLIALLSPLVIRLVGAILSKQDDDIRKESQK